MEVNMNKKNPIAKALKSPHLRKQVVSNKKKVSRQNLKRQLLSKSDALY
jgi:hypothetical protein